MIPRPASPASRAKIPSPITTTPADLKNKDACLPCANDAEPNESSASIGKVPRANANIISIPETNDPLPTAAICIVCVNPQGRKNVPNPIANGVNDLCSIFLKKLKIPTGKVTR